MKKYVSYIAAIIYLVFSTGILVNAHYCDNDLSSVNYFDYTQEKTCGCDSEDDGCCKDEQQFIKVTDHKDALSTFSIVPIALITQLPYLIYAPSALLADDNSVLENAEPPDIFNNTSLFIFIRVLRL